MMALLTASLVRPVVLAATAWLLLRLFRVRHPASQHAVWTAVLAGTLLLPIMSVLVPHWKLPVLPPKPVAPAPTVVVGVPEFHPSQLADPLPVVSPAGTRHDAIPVTLWVYFAGLLGMAAYRAMGWAMLWQVVARSRKLHARLRESTDVLTPVAVGVLRPAVILPAGWRAWDANKRKAVLTHEFAHLRRHDVLIAAFVRMVQCLLWFHPLAWWLSRTIPDLAESACDAAVLARMDDPAGYSRILLAFAETVNGAGQRVALPGLAMASGRGMGRRIDQMFELANGRVRRLGRLGVLLVLAGVPMVFAAATVGLGEHPARHPVPARQVAYAFLETAPAPANPFIPPAFIPPPPPQAPGPPPSAPLPKFEAVSVKPCTPGDTPGGRGGRGGGDTSPGRLDLRCRTVKSLIRDAYDLLADGHLWNGFITPDSRTAPIEGGPAWVDSERYSIDAKADSPARQEMMLGPLMRALLEERFKLKMRRETREVPVYMLSVAKGGFKLKPLPEGGCTPVEAFDFKQLAPGRKSPSLCGSAMLRRGSQEYGARGATVVFEGMAIKDVAQNLGWNILDRPVIDHTGIAGLYNFHLEFAPDEATPAFFTAGEPGTVPADPVGPSIFAAMLQEFGLKLEPAKGPGTVLIIDHVERPTEN